MLPNFHSMCCVAACGSPVEGLAASREDILQFECTPRPAHVLASASDEAQRCVQRWSLSC